MGGGAHGEQKSMVVALVPELGGGETPNVGARNQTLFLQKRSKCSYLQAISLALHFAYIIFKFKY